MHVIPSKSVCNSIRSHKNRIYVSRKIFNTYHTGVNKEDEYSWFYIAALQGQKGESITMFANMAEDDLQTLTRNNSLLFYSTNKHNWQPIKEPVWTDRAGIKQYTSFNIPTNQPFFISNTIFYSLSSLENEFAAYVKDNANICSQKIIGHSLLNNPLNLITFNKPRQNLGRILLTTGCHPAEPDTLASQAILEYLASPAAKTLINNYHIDVLPIQNPDGFAARSCLTHNGINLYWNFIKNDSKNCPEAYYLWQYICKHPPMLYIDFHSYVHQYHRHPMPYLKEALAYKGLFTKSIIKKMDRLLIKESRGFYRFGQLAMWPESLSSFITQKFNTIAYTKYHFNLYEGIPASKTRAVNIFSGLTNILVENKLNEKQILREPYGQVKPDTSDTFPATSFYQLSELYRRAFVYSKSYLRYYQHRNKTKLF